MIGRRSGDPDATVVEGLDRGTGDEPASAEGDTTRRPAAARSTAHLGRFELRRRIGRGGMGEVWEAWDPHLRRVAEAVHAAHREGLIHRDLKPSNILVESPEQGPPRPIVLDFGIARPLAGGRAAASADAELTVTGQVVGTPSYMAPERDAPPRPSPRWWRRRLPPRGTTSESGSKATSGAAGPSAC